jgi:hypothetical protein
MNMRTERIALGVALAVGVLAQNAASAQEYRGTMEQQMACTPDVWRLCSDQIPDVNRIVACLQQNTAQLSGGCRAVFLSNNQVQSPQPVPRNRVAPPPRYNTAPPPAAAPAPGSYDDDD